jgi:hypothetical protein
MTSPVSLSNVFYPTSPSFSSRQKLSERAQKLISLFKGMVPISNETTDYQGNRSRLWALTNGTFLGTVSHSHREPLIVPSDKILNFCTNKPISLENLRACLKSIQE